MDGTDLQKILTNFLEAILDAVIPKKNALKQTTQQVIQCNLSSFIHELVEIDFDFFLLSVRAWPAWNIPASLRTKLKTISGLHFFIKIHLWPLNHSLYEFV